MAGTEDALSVRIGRFTVGEHLARAVAARRLIAHDDGTWELPAKSGRGVPDIWLHNERSSSCQQLFFFLFGAAYGMSCVPQGCRNCYKVKISPANLRQLVAVQEVTKGVPYRSKCGPELFIPYSTGHYAAFFYLNGLEQARAAFAELRRMVDGKPRLGAGVPMLIKRGCTDYEIHCGPSDRYAFAPPEVEAWLLERLRPSKQIRSQPRSVTFARWIQIAFQIGDETYLDFTGGRRLYPKVLTYDPAPTEETGIRGTDR
ncbi:MAG TPA: hypothetical protein VN809_03850 [Telmatospirillum sp.]|nr:hypothetical protein [Telmatospirillum sp.]